ncbi:MAG TPA: serine hydrolase domain-containing protein [Steroidobacteraceae bacterium]|jgi:CubicO group peptidase (beta-lactamase class C family)
MRLTLIKISALTATALLIGSCSSKPDEVTRIDALMAAYQGDVPGASVLVVHDGLPVVRRAYGLADLEDKVKAGSATNYRLASMTKQFTAAAILLLMEQGKLTLDDPIRKWLPSLPQVDQPVLIRHLLTHTGGLIDYEDLIPDGTSEQVHDADVLRMLSTEERVYFPAGTAYRYSDTGYSLLSLIVARASGVNFAAFLRERIFKPLHMDGSVAFEAGISQVSNRAFGYSFEDGAWKRTDQSLTSAVLGDGGIYSSSDDLLKWDQALGDGRLLKKETLALAFTPQNETDDRNVQYGFGWRISGESIWHSGETMGFRNVIIRYPTRRLTVVVLTNRNDPEPYPIALAIAKLYYPDADRVRAVTSVTGPDPSLKPLPK